MRVIFDTNILIDHLRGHPEAVTRVKEAEEGKIYGIISAITVLELYAAPKMTSYRLVNLKTLLEIFECIAVENDIAQKAGEMLARYRASHGLDPLDSIIAATTVIQDAVLFTTNIKHFKYIEGLVALSPY